MNPKLHVAVIGAGAFGGWTALHLLRSGCRVTLLDAWGPGNSRASSGGESRIIRCTYGPNQPYTAMAHRAMKLWDENQRRWQRKLMHQVGVLWMVTAADDEYERGSLPLLRDARVLHEELTAAEMRKRWPQINCEDVRWGIFEPESGYILARLACQLVVEHFIAEGGEYRKTAVLPDSLDDGTCDGLKLSDGSHLVADEYVLACGPWLGKILPQTIGKNIRATKQEIFFFGTPPGDNLYNARNMPVWGDHRERFMYGIPANEGRGFKVADDTRGPEFDPTCGERNVSEAGLNRVRDYVAHRFPGLVNAPLIETRVCQYENTPDEHLIMDRHPEAENLWIVGGGSGHGFKHGPVVGGMMTDFVLGRKEPEPFFRITRFNH